MITKFNRYKLIKESPDNITLEDGTYLHCGDEDAVGFCCTTNEEQTEMEELFILDPGCLHGDQGYDGGEYSYPGRVWLNNKILTLGLS